MPKRRWGLIVGVIAWWTLIAASWALNDYLFADIYAGFGDSHSILRRVFPESESPKSSLQAPIVAPVSGDRATSERARNV
jgi:hypothetical protein